VTTDASVPSGQAALRAHLRLPLALLGALLAICGVSAALAPAGPLSWTLEVAPGLALVAVLVALHRRLPLSRFVYVAVFLHVLVLNYGGLYTYELTPLGNWARDTFHLARNPYDRVGHLALGVFPAFLVREVLLRRTPLRRGGWLYFLTVSVILAVGAFWELLEWWTTYFVGSDVGAAFLGSQGDPWDAQWDMLLALVGALLALPLVAGAHDRSMSRVPDVGPA
jgi:putative membrane protein